MKDRGAEIRDIVEEIIRVRHCCRAFGPVKVAPASLFVACARVCLVQDSQADNRVRG